MKTGKNSRNWSERVSITFLLGALYMLVIILALFPGQNIMAVDFYDNTTVATLLNVSNAAPVVSQVVLYDDDSEDLSGSIQLVESTTDTVWCNATVNDSNGWDDIEYANGTLFLNGYQTSGNDRNNRYENGSCSIRQNGAEPDSALVSCTFSVYFFADNGTWNCSITAVDNASVQSSDTSDTGRTIDPLYAIYLPNTTINYGLLNVTAISSVRPFNISNSGNMDIKLSVEGYGSDQGDNLAMNCSDSTSIGVAQEKYSINATANWSIGMTALTGSPLETGITGLTILQNQADNGNSTNSTYWSIRVPTGVETGPCTGSILFSAIPA